MVAISKKTLGYCLWSFCQLDWTQGNVGGGIFSMFKISQPIKPTLNDNHSGDRNFSFRQPLAVVSCLLISQPFHIARLLILPFNIDHIYAF